MSRNTHYLQEVTMNQVYVVESCDIIITVTGLLNRMTFKAIKFNPSFTVMTLGILGASVWW